MDSLVWDVTVHIKYEISTKVTTFGMLVDEKMKTTICVSWAKVIEGCDPFNRATNPGQIKINEHISN